jgi:hypothetical protein
MTCCFLSFSKVPIVSDRAIFSRARLHESYRTPPSYCCIFIRLMIDLYIYIIFFLASTTSTTTACFNVCSRYVCQSNITINETCSISDPRAERIDTTTVVDTSQQNYLQQLQNQNFQLKLGLGLGLGLAMLITTALAVGCCIYFTKW